MTSLPTIRRSFVGVIVGLAVALAACSSSGSGGGTSAAPVATSTVDLPPSYKFVPADITVKVGTTVTWTNRDGVPHSIVSAERHFTSPVLDADQRFSRRFDVPGTYTYSCSLHPKMTGQIVVG